MNNLRVVIVLAAAVAIMKTRVGSTTMYNGLANIAVGDNGGHSPVKVSLLC